MSAKKIVCPKCGGQDFDSQHRCRPCLNALTRERRERVRQSGRQTSCGMCGGTDFYPGGDCRPCNKRLRLARKRDACPTCGGTEFNTSNLCQRCQRRRSKVWSDRARAGERVTPCKVCGGMNFYPSGPCRDCRARRKAERAADPEKLAAHREWNRQWAAERRKEEKHLVHGRMAALVTASLKGRGGKKNGASWTELVGYDAAHLKGYLKATLPEGWTWEDYLAGRMQLDHRIPVAAFNFTSPKDHDFKRCWALTNLQLLPASENMSKRDTLAVPFQPSLI